MIEQKEFFKRLIEALNEACIPYMVSGSVGSSFHGRPRATNDFDIVIAPAEKQLDSFIKSLGKDFYVSTEAAQQALENNSMFNIIDRKTGGKADLILRKNRDFSYEELQRKNKAQIMGLDIWIASPEDVILSKLEWSKGRQSNNQYQDALGVAVVQWDHLDQDYLSKWAKNLQVENNLKQLLEHAKKLIDLK